MGRSGPRGVRRHVHPIRPCVVHKRPNDLTDAPCVVLHTLVGDPFMQSRSATLGGAARFADPAAYAGRRCAEAPGRLASHERLFSASRSSRASSWAGCALDTTSRSARGSRILRAARAGRPEPAGHRAVDPLTIPSVATATTATYVVRAHPHLGGRTGVEPQLTGARRSNVNTKCVRCRAGRGCAARPPPRSSSCRVAVPFGPSAPTTTSTATLLRFSISY